MEATGHPDFLEVFNTRRACCRALLELSQQQDELIAGDEFSQLLTLLGHKQQLLAKLSESMNSIPELWQTWSQHREHLSESVRSACEQILGQTEDVMQQLLEQESISSHNLQARRDETQRQLQSISHGASTCRAYQDDFQSETHRHLDLDR